MPRAFVLEQTALDVEPAGRFGQLVYVVAPGERRPAIWQPGFGAAVVRSLKAQAFDPEDDYFVMTGQSIPLAAAAAAIARAFGPFKALCFNSRAEIRGYEEVMFG